MHRVSNFCQLLPSVPPNYISCSVLLTFRFLHSAPETAKIVRSYPTIIDYAERIHTRYFPDYERWM